MENTEPERGAKGKLDPNSVRDIESAGKKWISFHPSTPTRGEIHFWRFDTNNSFIGT